MQAEHWQCSIDEYHNSPGESNSKLTDFLEDEQKYYLKHEAKTFIEPPKDCYKIGSSVHEHVLLENFGGRVKLIPSTVLNDQGHRKGAPWKEYKEENADYLLLNAAEWDKVNRYCDAITRNRTARQIVDECLADQTTEHSVRWLDPDTGLACRCRFDLFHRSVDGDVKTCRDNSPSAFARSIFNYGYHRQRVFYGFGSQLLRGNQGEVAPFWFFAVTEFSCRIYTISAEFEERGEMEVAKALDGIRRCRDSGQWAIGTEGDVIELGMPGYVYSLANYEVEEV